MLKWVADNLAILTLVGAITAFLYPPLFLIVKPVFLWLFAATMFALGLVLKPEELKETLRAPRAIGLGVLTQYTVMPTVGFIAASLSGLPPEIALGIIIVAAAPGAMASNVVVYLAGGAVAYSIALTTVATVLSPVLTPALVQWLGGAFMPIDFWPMMLTILKTVLLPLLLGMAAKHYIPKQVTPIVNAAPAIAVLAIVIICSYAIAANQTRLIELGPMLFLIVVVVNAAGYLIGWQLARLYRFDLQHRVTLSIEIGMQNAGLGVALALANFGPATALPGALFAVWCILTAAGMSSYLRKNGKIVPPS